MIVKSGRRVSMPINSLSGSQARAARAMLMWSVRQLAEHSGISDSSIRRIEASFGVPENVTLDLLVRLREFYEGRGFMFVWDENNGAGVFWKRAERRRGRDRRGSGGGSLGAAQIDPGILPGLLWLF